MILRRPLLAALATLALMSPACVGHNGDPPPGDGAEEGSPPAGTDAIPVFTEVSSETGLDFQHYLGATGRYYFAEIMGSGCALLDYDRDGDLDVYLVQGTLLQPGAEDSAAVFPPAVPLPPRNRLFRNDLIAGGRSSGRLSFTDVTIESGAGDTGYGMGVATGDYDNDGDVDLYLTNFGPDALLRNNGNGTFTDVTEPAGLGDPRWTASASFLDIDNDGFLDLFATTYADFTLATNKPCYTPAGALDYCGPRAYLSLPGRLSRNRGDGSFEDVTSALNVDMAYGHGLGVIAADFDENGWQDMYVANDSDMNQLWLNREGEGFEDAALLSGVAFNENGHPEAGMGLAVADHDDDGDLDLFVTHLLEESNRLYENQGQAFFQDATTRRGLAWPSLRFTGFGVAWFDMDHDADLDLFVANGNVRMEEVHRRTDYPFDQENLLLMNTGSGDYVDVSSSAGKITALSEVSRGVAAGDIDNDGDLDLLVANNNGLARLFRNDLEDKKSWLLLSVMDSRLNRDAIGARVRLTLSNGRVLTRTVRTDGSYLSAGDPRVHLAWPAGLEAVRLEVALQGGPYVEAEVPRAGRILTVKVGVDGVEITE